MISDKSKQQIFETVDILDIVSDFVSLRKRGVNYIGLCPFHNEKTPSFTVSPAKGIYKCFGCGKGGNPVNFVMEHEQLAYADALRFLAKKYQIDIEEIKASPEQKRLRDNREAMLVVTDFAQQFFKESLNKNNEGKSVAGPYLIERNYRNDIIKKFELGYCPEKEMSFSQTALKKGFKEEFLIKTGLSINRDGSLFDRFRGRIIFPIHSISGKVIGFGGRIMKDNVKVAKYVNSPESEIYHKGKILYGLFFAKKAITKENKCFLVEGYTDVLSLHQVGIDNVVASSGTALSPHQILQIKRFTNNISVIFDGDEAGIKASLRNIDLILEQDMNVKAIPLPKGEDPDSFAKNKSSTAFQKYVTTNELDFITYKAELLLRGAENDPVKKARSINELMRSVAIIPNHIVRSEYIKKCSQLFDVAEKVLYAELSRLLLQQREQNFKKERIDQKKIKTNLQTSVSTNPCEPEEKEIIRQLLTHGSKPLKKDKALKIGEFIISELKKDNIQSENKVYQQIFDEYENHFHQENFDALAYFRMHADPEVVHLTVNVLSNPYQLSEIWKEKYTEEKNDGQMMKTVVKLLYEYKHKKLQIFQKVLNKKIINAKKEGLGEELNKLIKEKIWLDKTKSEIAKKLGNRTII